MILASGSSMRRTPATRRRGGPLASSQRSQSVRMNLFVLVRILFQYLERVDRIILDLAKEVLKDCERKHNTKDSKYKTLADAISERVRDAVGESHWTKAREIQKQLARNQQKKKIKVSAQAQAQKVQRKLHMQQQEPNQRKVSLSQEPMDKEMKVAMTLSSISQQASQSPAVSINSSNLYSASKTIDQEDMDMTYPARRAEPGKADLAVKEDSTMLRGGATVASSGHLPLRKRRMFASPSDAPTPPASNTSGTSFCF